MFSYSLISPSTKHKAYKYIIDNELTMTMTSVGVDLETNLLDYINRVPSLAKVLWEMNRSAKLAEYFSLMITSTKVVRIFYLHSQNLIREGTQ